MKKVVFYDFDGTLIDSPEPESGKVIYEEITGKPYPHKGWWGRNESLDINVFTINPLYSIERLFRKDANDKETRVILLTNRLFKLSDPIMKILGINNMFFNHYSFKNDNRNKGERIYDILTLEYPNVELVEFYDDDMNNIEAVKDKLKGTYNFKLYHVVNGSIDSEITSYL
jgi:hydroxymethylpyrimidine pyrophosphatase-like HAD family hydrolase